MKTRHFLVATVGFTGLLSISAWAQSAPQSLGLQPPTDNAAVDAADAEAARHADAASPSANQTVEDASRDAANRYPMPSAYYYADPNPRNRTAQASACDDATYNQPQVHGSAEVGVVAGNHVSGNYQAGVVHVTKQLGSCEAPTGDVSVSVGVSKGTFNGSRGWRH